MLNTQDTTEYIRNRATEYLRKDRSGKGYICPICNSGSGKSGTGITTKDGIHFTCWAGCFTNADIIDIIGLENGITDNSRYIEKVNMAARAFNVSLDEMPAHTAPAQESRSIKPPASERGEEEIQTAFINAAAECISETDYMHRRGLSDSTLQRFKIGYCEEWKHPKAPAAPATPRIIIPTSNYSYIARDTREQIPEEQRKYSKSKVGKVRLFNPDALRTSSIPVFITEGEIDAMSICEVGGEAVGLGGTSNYTKLLEEVSKNRPAQPLIIALDNDAAGRATAQKLCAELAKLGIIHYRLNPYAPQYKDANELLQADRTRLQQYVERVNTAESIGAIQAEEAREEYISTHSTAAYLMDFLNGVRESINTPAISTGFAGIDKVLDGGLYTGLYTIGAISSLGKTTLTLQIADNIAAAGKDVLYFSLEMARSELMAKSISRHTIIDVLKNGGNTAHAKTNRGITAGERYAQYSPAEHTLISNSVNAYGTYAKHIFIEEGIGDIGVREIREAVERHINSTGTAPVVFIDYLQILAPYNERATDKQNTDKAVLELKRISRDYNIPVFAISSLNRDNYNTKISMAAFKESGAIEYSADVLIGLQFTGAGEKNFDAEAAKRKNPREIDFVILKQRNGSTGNIVAMEYFPMFNYYREKQ